MTPHLVPRPHELAWLFACALLGAAGRLFPLAALRSAAMIAAAAVTLPLPRARRPARALARGLATIAWMRARRKNTSDLLTPAARARLDDVVRRIDADGDIILLGIHLGPFELLPDLSTGLNRPVRYLHREYGWEPLDRMIRRWRCAAPNLTYAAPRSARDLARFGIAPGAAGLLLDGWPTRISPSPLAREGRGGGGSYIDIHGCATFSPVPVGWAARRGAAVWAASLWHESAGLGFDAVRIAPSSESEMAEQIRRFFESAVAAHPDDWICFCPARRDPAPAAEQEARHGVPAV